MNLSENPPEENGGEVDSVTPHTTRRMRLQRWMAQCGVGSRRACEDLIAAGRVAVNGQSVTRLGTTIDPEADSVAVDGRPLRKPNKSPREVWALYKPPGVTSTLSDPHARRTLLDLLPSELRRSGRRLFPVGRLDRDSEGLMLLTDDGDLAHRLTHPRYHVAKEYEVLVDMLLPNRVFGQWRQGIEVPAMEGEHASTRGTVVMRATARPGGRVETPGGPRGFLVIVTLYQGRKRQIRRMIEAAGARVFVLKRVRIGPIILGDLKPGEFRKIQGDERERLDEGN